MVQRQGVVQKGRINTSTKAYSVSEIVLVDWMVRLNADSITTDRHGITFLRGGQAEAVAIVLHQTRSYFFTTGNVRWMFFGARRKQIY